MIFSSLIMVRFLKNGVIKNSDRIICDIKTGGDS